jgi:hypothetical protein
MKNSYIDSYTYAIITCQTNKGNSDYFGWGGVELYGKYTGSMRKSIPGYVIKHSNKIIAKFKK